MDKKDRESEREKKKESAAVIKFSELMKCTNLKI